MSGPGRLTLCAAVATLATACSLLPLVKVSTWFLVAALLVAVQSAVGAGLRRVPLPRPLTVLCQALVSLVLITATCANDAALGGILPGPGTPAEIGALFGQAAKDIAEYEVPAALTPGIELLLVGGVVVIGLAVDALAVTYRSAAPAGLPLLALYSVAAGISPDSAFWLWFVSAAAGYLLLLLAESRERLSRWGRVFGGPARPGRPATQATAPAAVAPVRAGRRIGAVTLGIALVVPALLPTLSGGLLDQLRSSAAGKGSGGGVISAVNPAVSLQSSLNQPENRTVLTYRTTTEASQEMYLRIVSLDEFDGSEWKPSERRIVDTPEVLPPVRGLASGTRTETVNTTLSAASWYAQSWLPMPYPANRVTVEGKWRYEPEGRTIVGESGQTTRGVQYEVESLRLQPTRKQLANAGPPDRELREEYTRVPDSLPDEVEDIARNVTEGARNDYERAVELQDWFSSTGGFAYDTEVRAGSGTAAITTFLREKEGFCVHFSFTMAAMARTMDIPARVAVGFTPGESVGGGRNAVGLRDAHAWPELYFEGVGWTRFEPTPSRGTVPDYTLPETETGGGEDDLPARPQEEADDLPEPEPTPSQECTDQERQQDPQCGAASPRQDGGNAAGGGFPLRLTVTLAGLGLLAVGLPLVPTLWRRRVRARRLAPDAGVLAAWRETVDSAWDFGLLPDEAATPRRVAARIARDGELDHEAAAAAQRLAQAVEQLLYAPRPGPERGLADDVLLVRAALRAGASRREVLRAELLPRSVARLGWAVGDRWTRTADRARDALRNRLPLLRRLPLRRNGSPTA